ncbi:MAG: hypothetical protein AAF532_01995 [Planctomycetota bacterium]
MGLLGSRPYRLEVSDLCSSIRSGEYRGVLWFVDANIAINERFGEIWSALADAAVRNCEQTVHLPIAIRNEIGLTETRREDRLGELREMIRAAVWGASGWISRRVCGGDNRIADCAVDYAVLLSQWKVCWSLVGPSENGAARSRRELMGAIARSQGERSLRFAKEGLHELEGGGLKTADAQLVCDAMFTAIASGVPTMVLTADTGVVELWMKARWFLDTHCKSVLLARHFRKLKPRIGLLPESDWQRRIFNGSAGYAAVEDPTYDFLVPSEGGCRVSSGILCLDAARPVAVDYLQDLDVGMLPYVLAYRRSVEQMICSQDAAAWHINPGPLFASLRGQRLGWSPSAAVFGNFRVCPATYCGLGGVQRTIRWPFLDLIHLVANQERFSDIQPVAKSSPR